MYPPSSFDKLRTMADYYFAQNARLRYAERAYFGDGCTPVTNIAGVNHGARLRPQKGRPIRPAPGAGVE